MAPVTSQIPSVLRSPSLKCTELVVVLDDDYGLTESLHWFLKQLHLDWLTDVCRASLALSLEPLPQPLIIQGSWSCVGPTETSPTGLWTTALQPEEFGITAVAILVFQSQNWPYWTWLRPPRTHPEEYPALLSMNYKLNVTLHWGRLKTSYWGHKLIKKLLVIKCSLLLRL